MPSVSSSSSSASFAASVPRLLFTRRRYGVGNARPTHIEITAALATLNISIVDVSDTKEFKKKYLALVRQHHPDRGGNEEKMKDLTTAYDLLSSLSETERKEYLGRTKYGYGAGAGGGGQQPTNRATRQQRAPGQQRYGHSTYDFQDMYRRQYEDGFQYGSGGRTTQTTYRGQQHRADEQDPFAKWRNSGPFASPGANWSRAFYQAQRTPPSVIFVRLIVAYGFFVVLFVAFQRMRDDLSNQDGWSIAQQNSRADRMQQIYDSRSEFLERLKNRDMVKRMEVERDKERRVFDYAARRQGELSRMEFSSFPPLPGDGSMGSVFKVPADPVGILYFEPAMAGTFEAHMRGNSNAPPGIGIGGNMAMYQQQQMQQQQRYPPSAAIDQWQDKPLHQRQTEAVQRAAPPPYVQPQQSHPIFTQSLMQQQQQQQQQSSSTAPLPLSASTSLNEHLAAQARNREVQRAAAEARAAQQRDALASSPLQPPARPVFEQQGGESQRVYDHGKDAFLIVDHDEIAAKHAAAMRQPVPAAEQRLNPEQANATERNRQQYALAMERRAAGAALAQEAADAKKAAEART